MPYVRAGRSGIKLPAVSLGLWHNFGMNTPFETQRAIVRRAFDLGITHFDLANNYGPQPGAAEENLGRILRSDLRHHRDELLISTKAGFGMWPGPYGEWGSRKHMLASLDQSLRRTGLDHVDIFYSHRPDPGTPIEETMGALATAVHQGKTIYVGISNYSPEQTRKAADALTEHDVPLLVHQPAYSIFNQWVEDGLLDTLDELGVGTVAFSPLAQGLLTDRYLKDIPADSRAAGPSPFLSASNVKDETRARIVALNAIARGRGQSLAQMAIAWVLRGARVTSALVGASSVAQLEDNVAAVRNTVFTDDELAAIGRHASPAAQ
ncbi:aldo/keto reductase [Streptomyces sp. NPDC004014]